MLESPYQNELNGCRIVVFVETKSFTNKYQQLSFTKDQFQAVSKFLFEIFPVTGTHERLGESREIVTEEDIIVLPDTIECWYEDMD